MYNYILCMYIYIHNYTHTYTDIHSKLVAKSPNQKCFDLTLSVKKQRPCRWLNEIIRMALHPITRSFSTTAAQRFMVLIPPTSDLGQDDARHWKGLAANWRITGITWRTWEFTIHIHIIAIHMHVEKYALICMFFTCHVNAATRSES